MKGVTLRGLVVSRARKFALKLCQNLWHQTTDVTTMAEEGLSVPFRLTLGGYERLRKEL